ncbi:DUF2235 domain-containing protein [Aestuariibius sp. HNIBRBA575]|uniref:DUF2235 domain-containing protein n=1 Tax=Aestuariibius sp. HNIBRBA575 TaxID=3233343 RepID=UPI0034A46939
MKRIAIFCDGTWNRAYAPFPTNVVQLAQSVKLTADDGMSQHVFYQMGVGTGRGSNAVARKLDKWVGGVMGWGLIENVEDAYRTLVFCYEPGDEIYIFGFSRGAFTARSLAGLIRSCGIPPREHVHRIPEAINRYRSRDKDTHPRHSDSYAWRADFAPFTATSQDEFDWRLKNRPHMCTVLNIAYLGVWDTVGALGVPGFLHSAPLLNKGHQFHDAALSGSVKTARHAVAIDEHRPTFPPALWKNIEYRNETSLGPGWHDAPRETWPYRQEWFPGDHGSVGGGGDIAGLSSYTLEWIAEGAAKAGLSLRQDKLARFYVDQKIDAALINKKKSGGLAAKILRAKKAFRLGPDDVEMVSDVAKMRVSKVANYRPSVLGKVLEKIKK